MKSQHINIKLPKESMVKLEDMAKSMGMKRLTDVYGSIPLLIRFSITLAHSQLEKIASVIPPMKTSDLNLLLGSIKSKKIQEYQKLIEVIAKLTKE